LRCGLVFDTIKEICGSVVASFGETGMTNILIVDDSDVDRMLMEGLLRQKPGFVVIAADNGTMALQKLEEWTIDLVLTDLQMPKMDGLELVKQIRQRKLQIPVVLTTGQGSEDIAAAALKAGAAGYIPKNKLNQLLVSTVREVLEIFNHVEQNYCKLLSCSSVSHFEFEIGNDPELITQLVEFCEQMLRSMTSLDHIDCLRVAIAFDQAVRNAVYRGNLEIDSELKVPSTGSLEIESFPAVIRRRFSTPPFSERKTRVVMEIKPRGFIVRVTDEGPGFDTREVGNWMQPAARGTKLMKAFMDQVKYNAKGNEVELSYRFEWESGSGGQASVPERAVPTGWLTQQNTGQRTKIDQLKFVIGRRAACHLQLNGPTIAPLHCMLVVEGDHLMLLNLTPEFETMVNGKPGNGCQLKSGDLITMGEQEFLFED
jgi:CheY-like chemotaxis protein